MHLRVRETLINSSVSFRPQGEILYLVFTFLVFVIPAKAGIQKINEMDSRFRGNDGFLADLIDSRGTRFLPAAEMTNYSEGP